MTTDPIADFCSALQNAAYAKKRELTVPYSRIKEQIAKVMLDEGYLEKFEKIASGKNIFVLKLTIKDPALITKIKRISKPGLRQYVGFKEIPNILRGLGICVLSTSKGIMAGHKAKKMRMGGELLLSIY
ncbi:30S ribosomal protein S8 [Candidatus Methylacidiphilum fumarolicum]|uniref:Small ribosomal subunit protein uS8 n=2 Tax=Candidatus Methylacidiphilum fumarolicum TaxID=591154 RepID=I0K0C9_METFB|nr:30S ribosomal protein S8 [Candidatus Methylacidiphilum fumarolicum]MBW6414532.1 30S ribosomal protein S8 [Candidatus Methylacidiphilum fumarolicum]TFE65594.1 30S ribosomal protein S8 [Candidatus Methylacidiphilum fumarolicum]TFE73695.1 30S ribosomal protein S8 [Candidatus Methylacidiphilum fumarolicum]TFE75374.1 30S ribosomal protein S8 [Candidatus Methylacidiphilum fumarolicum]TFE77454.1 30S ribosomal protein S8 [Candidatus Methylacidiphilum fumarolicum]